MASLIIGGTYPTSILQGALRKIREFNMKRHNKWLKFQTSPIKSLNERRPINRIYRLSPIHPEYPDLFVYIDGYAQSRVGVAPFGTTPFVIKVDPIYLKDVTSEVERGDLTDIDVLTALDRFGLLPAE